MDFTFSKHVLFEIQRRKLSLDQLKMVTQNPEQIVEVRDKLLAYQSRVRCDSGKSYLLRVIVNVKKNPKLVVTAYKTSKVSKYWEG
jgi:hypothetical protein